MMKIIGGFNQENECLYLSVNSPLIRKFYSNFEGLILNATDAPKNITITKDSLDTAVINFPVKDGNPDSVIKEHLDKVVKVILGKFVSGALTKLFKTTEFLPILDFSGGYSFEEMQEDIKKAVEAKRDLCIIDSFANYKKSTEERKYVYNQYLITPANTDEYSDVVLLIIEGNLKELRNRYKNKLKETSWV